MREIKFRAWTEPENKMLSWNNLLNMNLHNALTIPEQCGLILMQYTGLKDKNGKEIYEGDILKIEKEDYKYIVKFYDGCFVGVNKYDEHYEQGKLLGNLFTLELEVIGNIYDNPDLLEREEENE